MKRLLLGLAWLGVMVSALSAQIVTYEVSGTFTFTSGDGGEAMPGIPSAPHPFFGTFTVDLSLNTSTAGALEGGSVDDNVVGHDFFGFSQSSLVSVSFTSGSLVFTAAELEPQSATADFWASSNLTTAPQYIAVSFIKDIGSNVYALNVGSVSWGKSSAIQNEVHTWDDFSANAIGAFAVNAVAVPEPSTYASLVGGAVLALALWRRRCVRR